MRSGTTLLVDYLNCHPQIRCRGEILGEGDQGYGAPYRMDHARLKLHVESLFVKRPGILAGATILTYHLDELPLQSADLAQVLHRPKIIVLYREETLGQFVSLKMAERDGLWQSRREAFADLARSRAIPGLCRPRAPHAAREHLGPG